MKSSSKSTDVIQNAGFVRMPNIVLNVMAVYFSAVTIVCKTVMAYFNFISRMVTMSTLKVSIVCKNVTVGIIVRCIHSKITHIFV